MQQMVETPALMSRENFGGTETVLTATDIAVAAAAAQTKAAVEARYIMAMRRPRDWDDVRQRLMKECRRPSFAENKSTLYRKPIGPGVEGLGIRFVEVALRCLSNIFIETPTVYDDDNKEIVRVSVTDLESNLTYTLDVRVLKQVERSKPMDDGSYLSVRKNKAGRDVYTVPATDDDILNKRGALISKAVRNLGLRVIPGDLQDEAEEIIRKVRLDKAAEDPDAERHRIADAFSQVGVRPSELAKYLGHGLDTCSPAEMVDLRGLYGALRDGETTWAEVMANVEEREAEAPLVDSVKKKGESTSVKTGAEDITPEWPKLIDGQWVDRAGVVYSPEAHARYTGPWPTMNADHTFRAKRGYTHLAKELEKEARERAAAQQQAGAEANQEQEQPAPEPEQEQGPPPSQDKPSLEDGLKMIAKAQNQQDLDMCEDFGRAYEGHEKRIFNDALTAKYRRLHEAEHTNKPE